MAKLKIMSIFGTRPEATKMAPLIQEINRHENMEQIICVTAQHRDMLDQVLHIFDIKPDVDLNIMAKNQTLADITVKAVKGLYDTITIHKPDLVLVHGDTTTSFCGSLAGFYGGAKVGHVEAGLRTYDKFQPYPEEMNRRLTGTIADIHFAPTKTSKENLLKENIKEETIFVTGNTAIDCMRTTIDKNYRFQTEALNHIDFQGKRVIAMTAHRRENLGKPLEDICKGVLDIVKTIPDAEVVYAVHLNPLVQETVYGILGDHPRVHLTDPLDLMDMHNLMDRSYLVLTDSGGLQEEVPHLNKPVLVLRNVTERPEGISAGTLKLVGTDRTQILKETTALFHDLSAYNKMAEAKNPFGDGFAAKRIVESIGYFFHLSKTKPSAYDG